MTSTEPTDHTPDAATRSALEELESRRIRALIEVDLTALDDIYDPSLIHIHAPGLTHNKTQLMEHTSTRRPYLAVSRRDLAVRLFGDIAVITGPLANVLRTPQGGQRTVSGQVTQVARLCDDGCWRYVSFQMTPDAEQVWGSLPSERGDVPSTEKD